MSDYVRINQTTIRNNNMNSSKFNDGVASTRSFSIAMNLVEPVKIHGMINSLVSSVAGIKPAEAGETLRDGIKSIDADGVPEFDETHPNFHHYYTENSCSKQDNWCTIENAYQGLLRYPAPGAEGSPIKDEQTSFALPVGYVRHEVDGSKKTILNVTLPNEHLLHPGIVQRWVDDSSENQITIKTYGEGTGALGALNSELADSLWKIVDSNIFEYMKNKE